MTLNPEDRARIAQTIDAIPTVASHGHGLDWWHPDTGDALKEATVELVGLGVPLDRALSVIKRVYGAVANEFGA
jgi:hypothetical protein